MFYEVGDKCSPENLHAKMVFRSLRQILSSQAQPTFTRLDRYVLRWMLSGRHNLRLKNYYLSASLQLSRPLQSFMASSFWCKSALRVSSDWSYMLSN